MINLTPIHLSDVPHIQSIKAWKWNNETMRLQYSVYGLQNALKSRKRRNKGQVPK
jgi:hypothetical protein